jgi:hypothetical protein
MYSKEVAPEQQENHNKITRLMAVVEKTLPLVIHPIPTKCLFENGKTTSVYLSHTGVFFMDVSRDGGETVRLTGKLTTSRGSREIDDLEIDFKEYTEEQLITLETSFAELVESS